MALVDVLYFGEVRERLGRDVDHLDLPSHVLTVADLIHWLAERADGYARAFADSGRIRVAVDREHAGLDDSFFGAAEVAFFPPVGAL